MEKEVNKKSVTLTKYEEIRAFLNGTFESPIVYYNSFITMEHFGLWSSRIFRVYRCDDKELQNTGKVVNDMIYIVAEKDLPTKEGICDFIKPYEGRGVYKIKVMEVDKIELKEREDN